MPNKNWSLVQKLQKWPAGLWIFSHLVSFKAPYFASISPKFVELQPGYASAKLKKRRSVTNHLGTVHAIAMANLCEFVGGTLMEISIGPKMRWIPKGMTIRYLDLAKSDLIAECRIENFDWRERQDVILQIAVRDTSGKRVSEAEIPMYVSPRRDS